MSKHLSNKERHEQKTIHQTSRNVRYDEMIKSEKDEKLKNKFRRKPYTPYHKSIGGN